MMIKDFSDEVRGVQLAVGDLGRRIPDADGMTVGAWRKMALATLGHSPSENPTRAQVLTAAGVAAHRQFETEERSRSGPLVSCFYGDPQKTWAPFMNEAQRMVRIVNDTRELSRPHAWRNLDGVVTSVEPPARGGAL